MCLDSNSQGDAHDPLNVANMESKNMESKKMLSSSAQTTKKRILDAMEKKI